MITDTIALSFVIKRWEMRKLSEKILTKTKQSDIISATNQGGTDQCTKDF